MADRAIVKANLKNTVTETNFQGFEKIHTGKVRDTYEKDDKRIILTEYSPPYRLKEQF